MEHADQDALEIGGVGFGRVAVDFAPGILALAMIDRIVREQQLSEFLVVAPLSLMSCAFLATQRSNNGFICSTLSLAHLAAHEAGAVDCDQDMRLLRALAPLVRDALLVPRSAAEELAIDLDDATQRRRHRLMLRHELAQGLANLPRRLL